MRDLFLLFRVPGLLSYFFPESVYFVPRVAQQPCLGCHEIQDRGQVAKGQDMFAPPTADLAHGRAISFQVGFGNMMTWYEVRVYTVVTSTMTNNPFLRFIKVPLIRTTSWPRSKIF